MAELAPPLRSSVARGARGGYDFSEERETMAEIRVEQERKRGLWWLWLLLAVALLALAAWYFMGGGASSTATTTAPDTTAATTTGAPGAPATTP